MRTLLVWGRSTSGTARAGLIAVVFGAVALTALIPVVANPRAQTREIVLVARDMTFYLEGSDVPNPTIVVKPGEDVRIVVKNEDPGIAHAFAVDALHLSVDQIQAATSAGLAFRAPTAPGRHEYVCPPHALMMRGILVVGQ